MTFDHPLRLILILGVALVITAIFLVGWQYLIVSKKTLPKLPDKLPDKKKEKTLEKKVDSQDNSKLEYLLLVHAQHVIHDSKNSIGSINRAAESTLNSIMNKYKLSDNEIDDELEQKLSGINQTCEQLIEKLGALQQRLYDTASLDLDKSIVDIRELCKKVRNSFELESKHVEITILSRNSDPPPSALRVDIDRKRIEEILKELVYNGIKFADPNKTDARVSIEFTMDEQYVSVHVLDNGRGIPDDVIDQIFQSGFRGSHAHQVEGTGYGLFTAKVYIEEHGGSISVNNHPKDRRGSETKWSTEFIVKLPREYKPNNT